MRPACPSKQLVISEGIARTSNTLEPHQSSSSSSDNTITLMKLTDDRVSEACLLVKSSTGRGSRKEVSGVSPTRESRRAVEGAPLEPPLESSKDNCQNNCNDNSESTFNNNCKTG